MPAKTVGKQLGSKSTGATSLKFLHRFGFDVILGPGRPIGRTNTYFDAQALHRYRRAKTGERYWRFLWL